MRFGNQEAPAGADDAVPGDATTARSGGHCIAHRASATGEFECAGEFAVGGDTTARDFLDQAIDRFPGHDGCPDASGYRHLLRHVGSRWRGITSLYSFVGLFGVVKSIRASEVVHRRGRRGEARSYKYAHMAFDGKYLTISSQ